MKLFPLFVAFLCCHLLGDGSAFGISSYNGNIASSLHAHRFDARAFEQKKVSQHPLLRNQPASPAQNDLLFFEENDNEEEHTKKFKLSTEQGSLFFAVFVSANPRVEIINFFLSYEPQRYVGTCKYLAQGVLRI